MPKKIKIVSGDFSNIRFIAAAFDLFLARMDGRKDTRDEIGKRYKISNANLNKFAERIADYFDMKGIGEDGSLSPDDMHEIAMIAQGYIADEKRRNKERKATSNLEKGLLSAAEAGMSEDDILRIVAKYSTIKQQMNDTTE